MDREGLLLVQVRDGNKKAFEAFLERFWRPIFALTYRFTGSSPESEDLCQDIFLRVYTNLNDFRGEGKTFTWLYRIAVNTCLNWKRKHKIVPSSMAVEEQASPHSTSYEALLKMELKDAFVSLSKDDRILILLRKFYGFSYEEIGEILTIPAAKVKSRLHEAKMRLASKLGPLLEGGEATWTAPAPNHN